MNYLIILIFLLFPVNSFAQNDQGNIQEINEVGNVANEELNEQAEPEVDEGYGNQDEEYYNSDENVNLDSEDINENTVAQNKVNSAL